MAIRTSASANQKHQNGHSKQKRAHVNQYTVTRKLIMHAKFDQSAIAVMIVTDKLIIPIYACRACTVIIML